MDELRVLYCVSNSNKASCKENGWDVNPEQIPEENMTSFIKYNKLINNGDGTYTRKRGEEGYYYISYEDVIIYKNLFGILDAFTDITYDNIY